MDKNSYWLPPNLEFQRMTDCHTTGRVDTFHQMPHTEWQCPNMYPGLPLDTRTHRYAWWTGRGMGDDTEHNAQVAGRYFDPESGEWKTMWWADPNSPVLQEQLALPEVQEMRRKTAEARTRAQSSIRELDPTQQARVRDLLDQGAFRSVYDALDQVRSEVGMPPVDYSDITAPTKSNTLAWTIIGGAALLFGGAGVYYWLKKR